MRHAALVLAAVLVAGCTSGRAPSPSSEVVAVASPNTVIQSAAPPTNAAPTATPELTSSPSATAQPLPADLPDDIRDAIAWRESIGLRADPDWVMAVHADPTAVDHWHWPILPEEEAFIWDRQAGFDPFVPRIQAYARQHRDVFGGIFIDNRHSRIMTLWTEDPEGHLAAILDVVGPDAPIAASLVRWSERELRDVQARVPFDDGWYERFDASVQGVGAHITENLVEIEVSSANPDAPRLIADAIARRLDVPVEILRVTSDGTGVELLPWGTVRGIVTWSDGTPAGGELDVRWVTHGIGGCGGGDIGYGVGRGGEFRVPCRIGTYTIEIWASRGDDSSVRVGHVEATVREDRTTRVRVRLEPGARKLVEQ